MIQLHFKLAVTIVFKEPLNTVNTLRGHSPTVGGVTEVSIAHAWHWTSCQSVRAIRAVFVTVPVLQVVIVLVVPSQSC